MPLKKGRKRINLFSSIKYENLQDGIFSENDFRKILERERSRADREGSSFTLIVFNTENTFLNGRTQKHLLETLHKRRVRSTDEVGWFEKKIGVLLHNTSTKGADSFASDVVAEIAATLPFISYNVYAYPGDRHNGCHENSNYREYRADEVSPEKSVRVLRREQVHTRLTMKNTPGLTHQPASQQSENCAGSIRDRRHLFISSPPTWKRVGDIIGALAIIIVLFPLMSAIAFAIKLTSEGPVLFRQLRSGLGGEPFVFYKFRSMIVDAEAKKAELLEFNERTGPVFKMADDPRITRVGKIIRKWSLDELPQLFNVLFGDMSLVGPRPPTLDEVPAYDKWHNRRLEVKPGITCIWQAYARHNKCFDEWVRMDIEYARNKSLLLDLKILLKTIQAVLSRKGAY